MPFGLYITVYTQGNNHPRRFKSLLLRGGPRPTFSALLSVSPPPLPRVVRHMIAKPSPSAPPPPGKESTCKLSASLDGGEMIVSMGNYNLGEHILENQGIQSSVFVIFLQGHGL